MDDQAGYEMSVTDAIVRIASFSAVGMWFHTYLDQWIEVRKPASGGKISITVHSDIGYRKERSPLSRVENMIRTGHWVPFRSRPLDADKAASLDRMLRVKESREVEEALKHMAKAFDLLGLPDASLGMRDISKERLDRTAVLEACEKLARQALNGGSCDGLVRASETVAGA